MRLSNKVRIVGVLLAGAMSCSCGSDPNVPSTLKQQQDAMHGPPPSADALKDAMSKVHFKTPGSDANQPPPGGAPPPGTKVGK